MWVCAILYSGESLPCAGSMGAAQSADTSGCKGHLTTGRIIDQVLDSYFNANRNHWIERFYRNVAAFIFGADSTRPHPSYSPQFDVRTSPVELRRITRMR